MVIKHITKAIRRAKAEIAYDYLIMAEDAVTMGIEVEECSKEFQKFFAEYLKHTRKDTS